MATYQISTKPICILFSHGGQVIGLNASKKCTTRTTTIPENCQVASFVEPGMLLSGEGTHIRNFCTTPGIRNTILEPLFLWHSISDIDPKTARYVEYEDIPRESPYIHDGRSAFEAPKRATAGAELGDVQFSFSYKSNPSFISNLGLYVHMPDNTIHHFQPSVLSGAHRNELYLSQLFAFIQSNSTIWNPAVGVAVILLSCQSYGIAGIGGLEQENIWMMPNLSEACDTLERLQQRANTEYQAVELYDRRQLREQYPVVHFPVFSDLISRARGAVPRKLNEISEILMGYIDKDIISSNIQNNSVNRTAMIQWGTEKKAYRASLDKLHKYSSRNKNRLVEQWVKNHPSPLNPVLVAREVARKAAEEKARRNANAATRKAKANKERSKMNKLQAARERKIYLQRFGTKAFEEKYRQPVPEGWEGGGLVFVTRKNRRR